MADEQFFIGRGWSFPPSFSHQGADVTMVAGTDDIQQSLEILFATQLGERVMQDEFGCDLQGFLFEEINQALLTGVKGMISNAILFHESRIRLDKIDVTESESQPGLLLISLFYTVKTTNSRYNMVYPFYLKEASV